MRSVKRNSDGDFAWRKWQPTGRKGECKMCGNFNNFLTKGLCRSCQKEENEFFRTPVLPEERIRISDLCLYCRRLRAYAQGNRCYARDNSRLTKKLYDEHEKAFVENCKKVASNYRCANKVVDYAEPEVEEPEKFTDYEAWKYVRKEVRKILRYRQPYDAQPTNGKRAKFDFRGDACSICKNEITSIATKRCETCLSMSKDEIFHRQMWQREGSQASDEMYHRQMWQREGSQVWTSASESPISSYASQAEF